MSTEWFLNVPGYAPEHIGTTAYGGINVGKVMYWKIPPAKVISAAPKSAYITDEANSPVSMTVATFFTEIVLWPTTVWRMSVAVNEKFEPKA